MTKTRAWQWALCCLGLTGAWARPLPPAEIASRVARHSRVLANIGELEGSIRPSPDFARYEREFEAALDGRTAHPTPRAALGESLERARLVLVGDVHTSPASQATSARVLAEMARGGGPLAVALEWIDKRHQAEVDAFLAGKLTADKLKKAIRFDSAWGFSWPSHVRLLEAIKARGAAVVLAEDQGRDEGLAARDAALAARIAAHAKAHPGTRWLVPYGIYHVLGKGHLADRLAKVVPGPRAVLVTAAPAIYWAALRKLGDPDRLATLALGGDVFLVPAGDPLDQDLAYRRYLLGLTGLELRDLKSERFAALHGD